MKVLVATPRTNGLVTGDYDWTVPGELVWVPMPCDSDLVDPDGLCGCGRGFGGLTSHRATTTAEVKDLDITVDELRHALRTSLTDQGWMSSRMTTTERAAMLREVLADVRDIAAHFSPGEVVRRRNYQFYAGAPPR